MSGKIRSTIWCKIQAENSNIRGTFVLQLVCRSLNKPCECSKPGHPCTKSFQDCSGQLLGQELRAEAASLVVHAVALPSRVHTKRVMRQHALLRRVLRRVLKRFSRLLSRRFQETFLGGVFWWFVEGRRVLRGGSFRESTSEGLLMVAFQLVVRVLSGDLIPLPRF